MASPSLYSDYLMSRRLKRPFRLLLYSISTGIRLRVLLFLFNYRFSSCGLIPKQLISISKFEKSILTYLISHVHMTCLVLSVNELGFVLFLILGVVSFLVCDKKFVLQRLLAYMAYPAYSFGDSSHGQGQQPVPFRTNTDSLKALLLHGNLDIWVREAKNLPTMFHKNLGDYFGKLGVKVGKRIEGHMKQKITSDPYVVVSVCGAVVARTFVIDNSEYPVWMQHFNVSVAHHALEVHFVVKDSDIVGSQVIGAVEIPVEELYSGKHVEGLYPILNSSGKPCKDGAILSLSIQYTPVEKISLYHMGRGLNSEYDGVPGTYFPLRKGGKLTLYQDAHAHDGLLPDLKLDGNIQYKQRSCWEDVSNAISQACRLIYITGWSVDYKVKLVRTGNGQKDRSLGDLLKKKSQVGVRVVLLVWDDPTSKSFLGYKTDGLMQTGDEETRHFFKHSSVQIFLCPRAGGRGHSFIKKQEVGTIYTHHQKTVIVDGDAGQNRRKIMAFLGGLDLCGGRYDTPEHPLFKTLETVHKEDCLNPNLVSPVGFGPREPWHDLHCLIDGPAAYDVLKNFEERWLKASKPRGFNKLKTSYDDTLLKIERIPDFVKMGEVPSSTINDPEDWHVQVFRSIDSSSVKGFPKDPKDAMRMNLLCGKNILIDMSIHTAYVNAIRSAHQFIYIENQYFLGSSYNWDAHKDLGVNNLIPMEIALKIASKIRAHERFCAYIVIPMWPEGIPTSNPIQRILYWQHKTMQMMYETIYNALVEAGLEDQYEPQDYLNFFCLGNRNAFDGTVSTNVRNSNAANKTPQAPSTKNRRFMIYVHSKGMITDDEYVIIGSANINQRSLDGTRDTEIAMGGYQPYHTRARKHSTPRGQIYGYRMSLWAEHMGGVEECFNNPESIECVRRVRHQSELNWKQYAAEEATDMKGHLLKYPVQVDKTGKVKALPGCKTFPDVGGNILGSYLALKGNNSLGSFLAIQGVNHLGSFLAIQENLTT